MRRRAFLGLLSGAVTLPLAARAQQPALPVVGFLNLQIAGGFTHLVAAFRRGLAEAGYVEGQNVAIEYRWADGQADRLAALADDLVRRRVSVIVLTGGAHVAAMAMTTPIPIIFSAGGDPVRLGLVNSINRPGGNRTGMTAFTSAIEAKRLELLHELVPGAAVIAALINPTHLYADTQREELQAAARAIRRRIRIVNASTEGELEAAFVALMRDRPAGLVVAGGPFFFNRRAQLLALTGRHVLPAIYENREFAVAGGLMSYGTNIPDMYRQIGVYTGRVLKGEKPGDLPILQPTKFDIAVNLKTAKVLGLEIPTSILLRANEVIE
jgi:putative ABC transport system substrate-binding protein